MILALGKYALVPLSSYLRRASQRPLTKELRLLYVPNFRKTRSPSKKESHQRVELSTLISSKYEKIFPPFLNQNTFKVQGTTYSFKLSSSDPKLQIDFEFEMNENPSGVWVTPLTTDLTHFFATQKRPVSVRGSYSSNGNSFQCSRIEKDCHMMIDIGRGSFNYGVAYFWVLLMTTLPDGRTLTLNLGDGIGSEFATKDKSTEDFAVLAGKHYKLDVTEMLHNKAQTRDSQIYTMHLFKAEYFSRKTIRTAESNSQGEKVFARSGCKLDFDPIDRHQEGMNAGVIAIRQHFSYGYFTGECEFEGQKVLIDKVYGHVEQVFNRW